MSTGGAAIHIGPAATDDLASLARLCSTAFADDAFTRWMHPDGAAREVVLEHMFAATLSEAIPMGGVLAALDPDAALVGVSIWLEPRVESAVGIPGDDPLARRMRAVQEATDAVRPVAPHVHLASMAVLPARRGEGIGAMMLEEGWCRAAARGLPCYLEASSQDNRRLYRRNGFVDIGAPIVAAPAAPPLWPMWRSL
ncbi:GNAT family N-acetyltransferase [Tsukamurella asaccharolytica]|uniref:GNAT family N-acetyltransferase n=1 Tax=Tsukamurella asaccharolytica TaxID=2592067 RepID=A0A5C5R4X7_9ACTN|nr:GNAT family N-acetyltransferase [Tsukamurella asaccharolytica]TWS17726.1 GNAT family N-acetyltransferase [Tsukamurella asaccharolytica]